MKHRMLKRSSSGLRPAFAFQFCPWPLRRRDPQRRFCQRGTKRAEGGRGNSFSILRFAARPLPLPPPLP